jgi:GGDEF domain-containing protein
MPSNHAGAEQDQPFSEPMLDKKTWHQAVEEAVAEAQANNTSLTVIFIDVNHFKDVNDTLGHAAGDEVIAEIRNLLVNNLRLSEKRLGEDRDLISASEARAPDLTGTEAEIDAEAGHIGGDEFGILCETGDKGARIIEGRLRNAFTDYMASKEGTELGDLELSLAIGVSVLQPGMTSAQLLRSADREMYEDKMRQLPPLNEEQEKFLSQLYLGLEQHNLRIRDIGKYTVLSARKKSTG